MCGWGAKPRQRKHQSTCSVNQWVSGGDHDHDYDERAHNDDYQDHGYEDNENNDNDYDDDNDLYYNDNNDQNEIMITMKKGLYLNC